MKSFIIFEKNLVLKADGSLPDLADLEKIKSYLKKIILKKKTSD